MRVAVQIARWLGEAQGIVERAVRVHRLIHRRPGISDLAIARNLLAQIILRFGESGSESRIVKRLGATDINLQTVLDAAKHVAAFAGMFLAFFHCADQPTTQFTERGDGNRQAHFALECQLAVCP